MYMVAVHTPQRTQLYLTTQTNVYCIEIFRYWALELSAEIFVYSNIRGSMPGNHIYQ